MSSSANQDYAQSRSRLDKAKHITYWKRCLKTYLPHYYTSADANRMMMAHFTISALDLLGALDTGVDEAERLNCLDWIYLCQHPNGGFRGSPGVMLESRPNAKNEDWDVASVPATFFALSVLAMLKDDFARVKRTQCLEWLRKLQRPDGSFGEHLGENGAVEGGMDTRFGFCAAGTRWMLRGRADGDVDGVPDIDVDALIRCIRQSQTFDGGISESSFTEPHAGYTYCALAALALLDALPSGIQQLSGENTAIKRQDGLISLEDTVRWLLFLQTDELGVDDAEDDEPVTDGENSGAQVSRWAGFCGRCNKLADTCYVWWAEASLQILGHLHLSDVEISKNFLYEKTQHRVGGFGKRAGDPPDVYHSFLGLAALAVLGDPDLKPVNATLCLSVDACQFVEQLPWRKEIWDQVENGSAAAAG